MKFFGSHRPSCSFAMLQGILFTQLLLLSMQPVRAEVTSIAAWQCSVWSERRAAAARVDPPQMWLSGYLTGLAAAYRIDALAITDASRVFEWMDKYCVAYPNEPISTGAAILFHDLAGRLPRGPAKQL